MNLLGGSILLALIIVVLLWPRRYALLGVMVGVLYVPSTQSIDVLGLNLFSVRLLELAAFVRVVSRRELLCSDLTRIDWAFLVFWLYTTIVFLLRSGENQAFQIGRAVDACVCYLAFRGLLRNLNEFRVFLRDLVLLAMPFVILVVVESMSGRNLFSVLGAGTSGDFRGGRLRSLGTFSFAGNLGTFGVSFLPLYIALLLAKEEKGLAAVGIALCLLMVWAANSGGPLSAVGVVAAAWLLWWQRTNMRRIRRCLVVLIILLALCMKAPIWYIPAKLSAIAGGTGWHRSYLLEMAWKSIDLWGVAGMPVSNTAEWFPYVLVSTGAADITSEYVSFGLTAGLPAIGLLIVVITRAFGALGRVLAVVRFGPLTSREDELLLWGLGVALVAHVTNWFGQSYFDQIKVVFYLHLAVVSTITAMVGHSVANSTIYGAEEHRRDLGREGRSLSPV